MRVLIAGATGLLGWEVAREFSREHEVIGWARNERACPVLLQRVDVTDERAVAQGISAIRPDLVIHTVALTDLDRCEKNPEESYRVNRDTVTYMAKASEKAGAFFLTISTDYVFDGLLGRSYRENDPTAPVNIYAKAKLEGERAALSFSARSLIVRVSGLFGWARVSLVTQMIRCFQEGKPVLAVATSRYSPSYTVDVAQGLLRLAGHSSPPRGILHLANSGGGSRYEVAQRLAQRMHFQENLVTPTTWEALQRVAKRPLHTPLDCSGFTRLTGASLRPWQEALDDFAREGVSRAS